MHALIIEDEFLIAMSIEFALRDCGFTSFDYSSSAHDAVAVAERTSPDLITADVELSPGCGITAVQEICRTRRTPVIFITAATEDVRAKMPKAELVAKPFLPDSLMEAVRLALPDR